MLACLVAFGFPLPLAAQDCGPAAAVEKRLWDQYQEVPAWQGVTADGSLIELYLSERGTWTIVQTMGGVTCARADGVDWLLPPPPQAPEEETET